MQEYEINNVLGQYDITVNSTRRTRGAILCDTDRGVFLLREVVTSDSRVPALFELYEHLGRQSCMQADFPVKNREGSYVSVTEEGGKYVLKRWPSGRECDIRKTVELLKASGNLAKLHILMQKELEHEACAAVHMKEEYIRHNRELKKVRRFMRGVSPKGEFEFAFLKCFDQMFCWAGAALELLENSGYDRLYAKSIEGSHMTHGEYNYHNILMAQAGQPMAQMTVITTNFEKFRRDVQVEDLYYFLRKILEKQGWRERLGDNLMNAYSAIKPLTEEELEYIKVRLIYPEKFWKIANSYYRSNKAWISAKSIEKIQTAIRQTEEKERFLNNIFSFHL